MYHFSYFKENDQQIVLDFIEQYPFAFITGSFANGDQVASQIPFLIEQKEGELYLQGHIMRNTDHHKAFIENPKVLAVFNGPHTYVSATWYTNPHTASTWNYMSVHTKGEIRFLNDDELVNCMRKLTLKYENNDPHSSTVFDNLPDSFLTPMLKAIVGIEIKVTEIDNVFKLSQNHNKETYLNIISKLEVQGGDAQKIAEEMKKRVIELYG